MAYIKRLVTPVKELSPFEWNIDWLQKGGGDCLNALGAMTFAQFWKHENTEFDKTLETELSYFLPNMQ
jgi:hypothetical protein